VSIPQFDTTVIERMGIKALFRL